MKISVCIGSSCHLKGSRQVVEQLQTLIAAYHFQDICELDGIFCFGKCQTGVNVAVDGVCFSVSPETTTAFFEKEVLAKINCKHKSPSP